MSKVLIVGGGAAGMFASITAARNGHEVCLFEKNEKLGKKLFITGKGRCNITNACDMETLFSSVTSNSKFLYSSFYGCTNGDVIQFFEGLGVRTKVERGDRVFPASDHSSDVIGAMEKEMRRLHIDVHLSTGVSRVKAEDGRFSCVGEWKESVRGFLYYCHRRTLLSIHRFYRGRLQVCTGVRA